MLKPLVLAVFCCLLLALAACSKPWYNERYRGDKPAMERSFDRDSTECERVSGEEFPLDRTRQIQRYKECMISKGWYERDATIPLKRRN
ncbi:hypothetical protein [Pseudodesulfovibrio tunisiensis]|uniref:hypothetical protein n=1 Tax=Pseudodesulfovibrio tunisiensis TaxID=463192 RepID=UPI001FB2189F|nr:hypothetical protein [Pseudodesulfovibrio tunisiensis]